MLSSCDKLNLNGERNRQHRKFSHVVDYKELLEIKKGAQQHDSIQQSKPAVFEFENNRLHESIKATLQ